MKKRGRPRIFSDAERKKRKAACNSAWRQGNLAKVRSACATREAKYRARHPERVADRQRRSHFKNMYGLTLEERDVLFAEQGRRCAICGTDETSHPKGWFVDHIHGTKIVRGILCNSCNSGIGFLKDDPVRCRAAADYLERLRTHHP